MELSPRAARNRGEYKRLSIYTIAASILAAACVVALIFTVWFTAAGYIWAAWLALRARRSP